MKYKFRINNKSYEVDLLDIHSQPITTVVNGDIIDVWLEEDDNHNNQRHNAQLFVENSQKTVIQKSEPVPAQVNDAAKKMVIHSPIPGIVIGVNISVGDQVQQGQELCIIEAMKMKNIIRSPRDGKIKLVNIRIGQAVQHRDILFEYSE